MKKPEIEFDALEQLPKTWEWTPLEMLVPLPKTDIVDGPFGSNLKASEYKDEGIPIARLQNIDRNNFIYKNIKFVSLQKAEDLNRHNFQPGDLLITKLGYPLGEACIAPKRISHGIIVADLIRVRVNPDNLNRQYLTYAINSPFLIRQFEKHTKGTTRPRINLGVVRKLPIPIAPKNEQDRIVEEIEKQFSRLDEAVAALKRIRVNLKRYKASVLNAAVEGKLTEEWRKEHPDIESAKELLKRILIERKRKWEEAELEKMRAKGKEPKDDKWKKKYKEPELPKEEEIFDLPDTWVWSTLGQVSWSVKDGPHYSPKYSETGIPFISGGNVRPEGIDFSVTKYISKELHEKLSERCKPEYGDLLYTKGGTTGIARINTETREFNVWVHVAVLRLVDSLEKFYLQNALNSPHCYKQSQNYTHGVGNQDLGLTRMIWITLPLPPIEEQKEVIKIIEERISIIDEINKEIDLNLKHAERLRQSILKKAFSGKLVSREAVAI